MPRRVGLARVGGERTGREGIDVKRAVMKELL
jgi:hypothetical protein